MSKKFLVALIILIISTSLIISCSNQNYKKESSSLLVESATSQTTSAKQIIESSESQLVSSNELSKSVVPTSSDKELLVSHDLSVPNSVNNINAKKSAEYINGYILNPGQQFSFNKIVGERTEARGFVEGWTLAPNKNGKLIDVSVIGSGVCRTSTAIYQTAKLAGLNIIERHNHPFLVAYAKPGDDAAISWGRMDNIFQNNKDYPILIECSVIVGKSSTIISVQFYKLNQ
jgi:vancomycin resistance protein YoaR